MRSTNDIKRAWKIPPVERPPEDEEESLGGEDSDPDGEEAALRERRGEIQDEIDAAHAAGNHELAEELESCLS